MCSNIMSINKLLSKLDILKVCFNLSTKYNIFILFGEVKYAVYQYAISRKVTTKNNIYFIITMILIFALLTITY